MRHKLFLFVLLTICVTTATTARSQENREAHSGPRVSTLTVSGQGEVSAPPDHALVRLGAEVQAATAQAAQSQVNAIMTRALQKIRTLGIEERKVQTSGLQLFPVYDHSRDGEQATPRLIAYRASNTVQVDVDNLQLVGKVIDAGVAAGANRLEGISFGLRHDLPSRTQALQNAVARARTKAETLAAALGVNLQGIEEVREEGVHQIPPPQPYGDMMMRAEAASTPVQPGEMQVQSSIIIRYRIAPR